MKVYISRDEDSDEIWIWLQPKKGNWKPENVGGKEFVNYQRQAMDEVEKYCCYDKADFKKKFKIPIIKKKTCKCVHLPDKLVLDNVDALTQLYFG